MNDLNYLIKFIETHQLTNQLIFTLVSRKDTTGLQIKWDPTEKYSKWSYKELFSSEWVDTSNHQLEQLVVRYQIDRNIFSSDLKELLLQNTSDHYMVVSEH